MRKEVVGRIGWIVFFGWALLAGRSLEAQPMPWPSDLSEEEKTSPPPVEKPTGPTTPSEPAGAKVAEGPAGEPSVPGAFRELKPSLYYLKDKQGNLQPVPGFTLEEFRELYELKHLLEQKAQPPLYSFQGLDIQGTVRGAQVEVSLEFRVALRESPARIPLGLEGMAVQKFEGEGLAGALKGEYQLHIENPGEGYVAWVSGAAGSTHLLRLEGLLPIRQIGEQRRLRFRCPRAPMSQMRLRVPGEGLKVEASDPGTMLEVVPASEGHTELKVVGIGGNVELVWWPAGQWSPEPPTVFDVTGEILVRIGTQKITTQVNLFIKGLGQPCDELALRLPESARLNPSSVAGGTVTVEKDQRVKVHFLEKALEHRVRLEWEQAISSSPAETWVELGGVEVEGAVKHRGYIAVSATGDWHLLWRPSASVRQTEQLPPSLSAEGVVAGFEYTSQPYSLRARLVAKQVRVSVEPEYRVWVGAREAKLEGVLKYTIRGAKVQAFRMEMPGWEVEEVGPEHLVVAEAAAATEGRLLSIPLKEPTVGHVEITVVARQAIAPGAKQLHLLLPQNWQVEWPSAASVSVLPASLVVIPDDNVELVPDEKQMSGWVRQLAANPAGLPKRQQPILAYRGESGTGALVAGFRVHERQIRVEGTAQVQVEEDGVRVEEKLSYTIAYEVLGTLRVWVPSAVASSREVQFMVDGQSATAVPVSTLPKAPQDAGPVEMAIALSQPRIGACDLVIRYRLPSEKILANQSQLRTVPLVLPAEGQWTGWRMGVTGAEGLQIKIRSGNWKPLEGAAEPTGKGSRIAVGCGETASEITLAVYRELIRSGRPAIVSRAFVQTWFTRSLRQDRAVYRLTSGRQEFSVRLPEGAALGEVEVWVNGQPAAIEIEPDGRVSIPLPLEKAEEGVVEIRYHFTDPRPPRGPLSIAFPRPEPDVWIDRLYWLCYLPRDEHLLSNPAGFAPEYHWQWNGWSWGRTPSWTQADLETWAGVPPWPMSPEGVNSYLFSTVGRFELASVYTANRSVMVLTASLVALGLGLLVVYVPLFRHPAWAVVVAVGLGALALVYPEQTVLGVQAALLGVILAVLAGLLQRTIAAREGRPITRSPGLVLDQESTQRQYPPPASGSTSSTQAVRSPGPPTISPDVVS